MVFCIRYALKEVKCIFIMIQNPFVSEYLIKGTHLMKTNIKVTHNIGYLPMKINLRFIFQTESNNFTEFLV